MHVETCSNVKVQKGAVKCFPKNVYFLKSIFLWQKLHFLVGL